MLRYLVFIICCTLLPVAFAKTTTHSAPKIEHVIYITLDGVRWQEVYQDHQYFPNIWRYFKNDLTFYGEPGTSSTIEVASIPVSLPSYQSQMTGSVQSCNDNDCGRIKIQTFPEKLALRSDFSNKDVAMFGTWATMHDAYQTINGRAYESAGNVAVSEPGSGVVDSVMSEVNLLQSIRTRHGGDRYDYFTMQHAMHYFLKYQPKFMWISLTESDNYAHDGDLAGYHASLRLYDDFLAHLFATIKHLGLDEKTMVIVTTDHGRGNGDKWTDHGPELPESKQTWAFVWHGQLLPVAKDHYSTLSIRPTIERVFA